MTKEHIFQPIVTVVLQDDGTYAAEVDWSSSFSSTYDTEAYTYDESGESPEAVAACAAVDAWVKTITSNRFVFPAAEEVEAEREE